MRTEDAVRLDSARERLDYALVNDDRNIPLAARQLHATAASAEALLVIASATHQLVDLAQQLIDQLTPLQATVRQPDTWPIGDC